MNYRILLIMGLLFFYVCSCGRKQIGKDREPEEGGKYENFDAFEDRIHGLARVLGEKYGMLEYDFDVECIYEEKDLSELVKEMLDFAGFEYKQLKSGHKEETKEYYLVLEVGGKEYEFRTSSLGDYVNLETILPSLDSITSHHKPTYEYNFSNADGGQVAAMIFVKSTDLVQAVEEGYPCSLPSGRWPRAIDWDWGTYSDIEIKKIPSFEQLRTTFHTTLVQLHEEGFAVPSLTLERLYLTDLFKTSQVDIIVDGGGGTASNAIVGNQIRCFWDGWGLVLAYTLIKHYKGQPTLFLKETEATLQLSPKEYLEKAEQAFGRR